MSIPTMGFEATIPASEQESSARLISRGQRHWLSSATRLCICRIHYDAFLLIAVQIVYFGHMESVLFDTQCTTGSRITPAAIVCIDQQYNSRVARC